MCNNRYGSKMSLLLIAQLVERWCASLENTDSNPGMSYSESAIIRGNLSTLLPPDTFSCNTCKNDPSLFHDKGIMVPWALVMSFHWIGFLVVDLIAKLSLSLSST